MTLIFLHVQEFKVHSNLSFKIKILLSFFTFFFEKFVCKSRRIISRTAKILVKK